MLHFGQKNPNSRTLKIITSWVFNSLQIFLTGNRQTDIIFVLDTSRSLFQSHQDDIKAFLQAFTAKFTSSNNTRYGLVTYSTNVQTYLSLNDHKSAQHLVQMFEYVRAGRKDKQSYLGLDECARIFQEESDQRRKKIAVVITNGFSKGMLEYDRKAYRNRKNLIIKYTLHFHIN